MNHTPSDDHIKIETGTEELLVHIEQRVGVITLNKPDKKNALGDILTPALWQALLDLDADDRVGCIMITGAGDAFCSGGDVSGMGGGNSGADTAPRPRSKSEQIDALTEKQQTLTQRIYELGTVTIAAIPGAAAGAGLSIALACDLRIIADTAFVTTAFRNIGLSGDYGSSWFLPKLIGLSKAKELFYTADRIGAEEGAALGLFNKVFPKSSFRTDALDYAATIANGPTIALGRMKHNLQAGMSQDLPTSLRLEAEQIIDSFATDESSEAIKAFMQKRKPNFHQKN